MSSYSPSNYVLAAILGNWQGESGINPGRWEGGYVPSDPNPWAHEYQYDGIGGYGLGQWTNIGTPYGRCYDCWYYLTSNGYATDDGYGECEFFEYENHWTANTTAINNSHYHYTALTQFMNSSETNTDYLTDDFMRCWEGIFNSTEASRRHGYASDWLTYIQNNDAAWRTETQQPAWFAMNAYMTQSQLENNAKCAWWYFNMGGSPGPGPGPTPGTFPSLWLMFAFGKKLPKGYRKIRGN